MKIYIRNGEVRLSRIKDYREFINRFDFERYFIGHDFPDDKTGVNNYLDELEGNALEQRYP